MDPLVRAALTAQKLVARGFGVLLAAAFGAYLLQVARGEAHPLANALVAALFLASLGLSAERRLRRLQAERTTQLDLELFCQLIVGVYGGLLHATGGLDGPFYPVVYAVMMLVAAFARPGATVGTALFAVGLEAALGHFALERGLAELWPHALMLGLFALLNLAVFRAEIARVRRLSRSRLRSELERMRDDARSYRLIGAPASAVEPASRPAAGSPRSSSGAELERLLRSSVDEIRVALQLVLDLARRALGVRSVALLWLASGGRRTVLREISTDHEDLRGGPFDAAEGLVAAALTSGEAVPLTGAQASRCVPYYTTSPLVGAACAVPVLEHGHARGVLMVDRAAARPFDEQDVEQLHAVTRFVLRVIENERVFVQLERAKTEQGKLYRAVDLLAAATTEGQVIEAGVSSAREFASFELAVVTLFHRASGTHEICAASGEGADALVGRSFRHNAGLVSMAVANRHPLPYRGTYDPSHHVVFTRKLRPPAMASLLVLPLVVHDRALGTLILGSNERGVFGDAVRPTLEVLARHIAVSLANARMVKRLGELATTDGLTGLLNKRSLTEMAQAKLKSAQRFHKPLSVLVCDIDHFKKVNDSYGHDVGDVVIRGFADVLKRTKRDTDAVGRFGGEEFVLVCEETDVEGAALLGERIRAELEATTFHTPGGPLHVTCSVGAATFPQAGADWETLFKATDEALYASKRGGRNRVTTWRPGSRGAAA